MCKRPHSGFPYPQAGKTLKNSQCLRSKTVANSICCSPNQDGCRDKQVGEIGTLNALDGDGSYPRWNEGG